MGGCSVAVAHYHSGDTQILASVHKVMNKGHAETLLPMIQNQMAQCSVSFDDLDRIAVTTGPGTFTGVRIGVATARGLALASGLPLVSASTLHIIALRWLRLIKTDNPAILQDYTSFVVAMDARREEAYVQTFSMDGVPLDHAKIQSLGAKDFALGQADGRRLYIGSAASLIEGGKNVGEGTILPEAYDLALIAGELEGSAKKLSPLYLRAADAKPQTGKAIARQ